ncbi:MAG: hypothetical protein IPO25_16915 [Saprospiraceae bacterium]|nr:hypothetical protein [Saprospiraceae bacterium]
MSQQQQKEIKITNWFAEYGNRVLRFIKSKIGDLEEAEDISQEVWYQLSRQDELDDIEQISSWLFTAANNRVINFYKKKKTIPFSSLEKPDLGDEDGDKISEGLSFNEWAEASLPSEIL